MVKQSVLVTLNTLLDQPFEQWPLRLKAVSANSDGRVNSGILKDGTYFYRKWSNVFTVSEFVIEK